MPFIGYSQFTNVAAWYKGNVKMRFKFWISICSLVPSHYFIICQTSQLYIIRAAWISSYFSYWNIFKTIFEVLTLLQYVLYMLQLVDRIDNVSCNTEVYLDLCILDTYHMLVPFNPHSQIACNSAHFWMCYSRLLLSLGFGTIWLCRT
jgi:hypothetical protein